MNKIHRFGDSAEIDEKNRVKMYKKGSQWVTANQTSFMLLGKHALAKGLAITLGTVALGLTSGQAASADSMTSASSGAQSITDKTTNNADASSSNTVTLKSSTNPSAEVNETTSSTNNNTYQAASGSTTTNAATAAALQANLASMTTSSSTNADNQSSTSTTTETSSNTDQSASSNSTSSDNKAAEQTNAVSTSTDQSANSSAKKAMAKAALLSSDDASTSTDTSSTAQTITIKYVDSDGNEQGTSSLSGEAGTSMQITKDDLSIPDGWTVDDSQTLPITFTPDTDATKNVVNVTIKHLIVTVTYNKPYNDGTLIPGTTAKYFSGVANSDLNRSILRWVDYHFPASPVTTKGDYYASETEYFVRDAEVDAVTGQVTYTKWQVKQGSDNLHEFYHNLNYDIDGFTRIYTVNEITSDSTTLDEVIPYDDNGDLVVVDGGVLVRNKNIKIAVNFLDQRALQKDVDAAPDNKKLEKYLNATESLKKAYDDAVADGQTLLNKLKDKKVIQTQDEINTAVSKIENAWNDLKGEATKYDELQKAVAEASTTQNTDKYLNATGDKARVYDEAIAAGNSLLDGKLHSQDDVDAALAKITEALNALDGTETNYEELNQAVQDAPNNKQSDRYLNTKDKDAYDKAVEAGQTILDELKNGKAHSQKDVTKAADAINNALGKATDYSKLKEAVAAAPTTQNTDKYLNATGDKAKVYDEAITAGNSLLDGKLHSQDDVDAALAKITEALNALDGTETDYEELNQAVQDAPNNKQSDRYLNTKDKDAYDKAVEAGQTILDELKNGKAHSQKDVTKAADAINNALGEATDYSKLKKAVAAAPTTQNTDKYLNATGDKAKVYDEAITAGNSLLDGKLHSQDDVDAALAKITEALNALDGTETNYEELNQAVQDAPNNKQSDRYLNTKDKDAYDKAVEAGQTILDELKNGKAHSQKDVTKAADAINNALGKATDYSKLKEAVAAAPTTQNTDKYLNATGDKAKVYDEAITAGNSLLDGKLHSQDDVDAALAKITEALNALDGTETDYEELNQAVQDAPNNKQSDRYLNTKDKDAYDKAVEAGQTILDELKNGKAHSQKDVTKAADAINNALGEATDYSKLKEAVDAAPTKKQTEAYLNADDKQAYDDAVAAGKALLDGKAHSQTDVNAAFDAIKAALNGKDTDYTALQKAVNDADDNRKTYKYINATDPKAYDDAVTAGKALLDGKAHSQLDVNAAVDAIKKALDGKPTDTTQLKKDVKLGTDTQKEDKYRNADDDKKKALDDAIKYGQDVLKDQDADQKTVNNADQAIKDALANLNGEATDKTKLEKDIAQGNSIKQDFKYRNADPDKQKALDDALSHGQEVFDDQNADQKTVDAADQAIKDALNNLNGEATDKTELQKDVNQGNQAKTTDAYKNADTDKQKALDDAIKYGQDVFNDPTADQKTVNNADQAINDALANLNGQATDKTELEKDIEQGNKIKQDFKYRNADPDKQQALDDALSYGQDVFDDQNADQNTVDAADQAIKDALNNLNGEATDKTQLQKDVNQGNQAKTTDAYKNADADKQKALDDAIKYGQDVLNDQDADQKTINNADQAIKDALANLNGQATDKTKLEKDIDQGNNTKQDFKYRNADPDKQKALDDAISHGQDVFDDQNADQKTVDAADQAVKDALKNLNGEATDKSQLEKDIDQGNQAKTTDAYKNADADKQKALDDAIKYGQDVLDDPTADQKKVDDADQAIKDALNGLNGQATDKSKLQEDINQGDQTKQDDKYRNADADKQKALDDAIKHGQDVLNDPTADQKTVDDADQAIKDAEKNLNGETTDKGQLQKDIDQGTQIKQDDKYRNADADKQKALDDAIKYGQDVLNDPTADQKKVDDADQAIKDAENNLNGQATDKSQLEKDIDQGNQAKSTDAYKNADSDKQKALDDAIKHGQDVLNDSTADQKTVNDADLAIKDAENALNGQQTDKSQLQNDIDQGNRIKTNDIYKNADADKQKALDDAIKHGQDVLNDQTADQKTVDQADQAIKDALKDLDGLTTDKSKLQEDINKGNQIKQTDKYQKADADKQKALDDAIKYGQDILNDQTVDQKTVDDADQTIKDALQDLNGRADKTQLQEDIDHANQTKNDDAYKNADADKQKALDDAIKHGQDVLNDPSADQKAINQADQAIKDAEKALNGQATDKSQLQNDINEGSQIKKHDKYRRADQDKQRALDDAIEYGKDVLNNQNADQKTVDNADQAIKDAIKDLNGQADKTELQKDVDQGNQIKQNDKYRNADADKQKALDDAIKYGEDVLNDPNAEQEAVDEADQAIKDALNNLNGQATDKSQLEKDIDRGKQAKSKDIYKHADADKQQALDDAINYGQDVLNNPNADQKMVNDADRAIKDALDNLNGQADKSQLQKDVDQGTQIKQNDKYRNADADKQKALDDAIKHGEDVLNDPNAEQEAVDEADQAIKDALNNLNGQATDKNQLEKDIDQGKQIKQHTKYQKADAAKRQILDDAIEYGQDVLNNSNADQKMVDDADRAIRDAIKDLNGQADKVQLQKDVDQANQIKNSDAYKNASEDAQKALDDAIKDGQDVLNDPNADQAAVDEAVAKLEQAMKAIQADKSNAGEADNDENNQDGNSQNAATAANGENNTLVAGQGQNSQSSADNQEQNDQSNAKTLPQTGNQEGAWTVLAGLMATMLGSLGLMLGKKKGQDDEEKN